MDHPGINRREFALGLAASAAALSAPPALAQAPYPNRPIRLVAPFPAGGAADVVARILAPRLTETLQQPVVIENRAGAGGAIGSAFVASAPADGHTLLINLGPPHQTIHLFAKALTYQPLKDFAAIALLATAPQAIVVPASSAYKTIQEFLTAARTGSKGLTYGTSGVGTSQHLAGLLLAVSQKANLTHVGYRGGSAALNDVLGGQTDAAIVVLSNVLPHIRAGRLRALAVLEGHRALGAPEVPTLAESGVREFSLPDTWVGVLGPAKLPPMVIARLHAELARLTLEPEVRAQLERAGYEPKSATPEEFSRQIAQSEQLYRGIASAAGVVPE